MKENQKLGAVALGLGVLLFVPLLLAMVYIGVEAFGMRVSESGNAFDILRDMGEADDFLFTMTGIFSVITMIVAVAMIVMGVLLLIDQQTDFLKKHYKISTIVAASVGLLTGLFALLFAVTYGETISGMGTYAKVGIGAILLLVVGAAGIAQAFILGKKE